jgi:glucose-1-phosphate thymidylyltransferase
MKVIIPVAGVGTRLRPHTFTIPKALIPVAGKPMIDHIIEMLVGLKPTEMSLVVGFLGDQLVDYLEGHYSLPFHFYHQTERKGLGHAVWHVLKDGSDDKTLIVLGDTILDLDYNMVVDSKEALIGVKEVEDPRRFGVVELDGEYVSRLEEKPDKPSTNLAIVGLYYFPSSKSLGDALSTLIEKDIRTRGEYQLTDALQILIDKGEPMRTIPVEGWYDCGKPETLLETQRIILDKKRGSRELIDGSVIHSPVYLSEKAIIDGSVVGPYVTAADGVIIRNSIVSDSIICKGAKLDGCNVTGSIVGVEAKVKGKGIQLNIGQKAEFFQ